MTEAVTLNLPTDLVARARAEGARTGQPAEEILAEWAVRDGTPPDALRDDEILALCGLQMPEAEQSEMSDLLWKQREEKIGADERPRLGELLAIYRSGLVRKAEALRVAVSRGLIAPLGTA